jgi:hypothetical protein
MILIFLLLHDCFLLNNSKNIKIMKTVKRLLFLIAGICLMISCSESDETLMVDDPQGSHLKSGKSGPVTVTVPFKADFIGEYKSVLPDPTCTPPQGVRIIVDFEGTGTHLGKFTGNFNFCADAESYYGPTESYMVAANGDILYVSIEGQVIGGREDDHNSSLDPNSHHHWVGTITLVKGKR